MFCALSEGVMTLRGVRAGNGCIGSLVWAVGHPRGDPAGFQSRVTSGYTLSTNLKDRSANVTEGGITVRRSLPFLSLVLTATLGCVPGGPGAAPAPSLRNVLTAEELGGFPLQIVSELRFIHSRHATTRWGTGYPDGVIHVITRPS